MVDYTVLSDKSYLATKQSLFSDYSKFLSEFIFDFVQITEVDMAKQKISTT